MKRRLTTITPKLRVLPQAACLAALMMVFGCTAKQSSEPDPTGGTIGLGDGQKVVVEESPNGKQGDQGASQQEAPATGEQGKSTAQVNPGATSNNSSNANQGGNNPAGGSTTVNPNPAGGSTINNPGDNTVPDSVNVPGVGGENLFEEDNDNTGGRDNGTNQCTYARAQNTTAGFGLQGTVGGYIPPSVIIRMTLLENGQRKTRRCVGVLGVQKYEVTLTGNDVSKVLNAEGDKEALYFPRVSMAKHCAQTALPVEEILVVDVKEAQANTDANGKINYDAIKKKTVYKLNQANLELVNQENQAEWFLDREGLSHSFATVRQEPGSDECSTTAKDNKLDMACFTAKTDRINVIMLEERDLIKSAKRNGEVTIKNYDATKYYGDAVEVTSSSQFGTDIGDQGHRGFLVSTLNNQIFNWESYYMSRRVKVLDEVELKSCDLKASFDSVDDVIKCWDKTLRRIQPTQLVKGNAAEKTTAPIELKAGQSWDDIIRVFGKQESDKFTIEAVGLKSNPGFKEGHSGTILVGEFIRANLTESIEVTSSKRILGSLSTVAGNPVCTGDDLQCCEKID